MAHHTPDRAATGVGSRISPGPSRGRTGTEREEDGKGVLHDYFAWATTTTMSAYHQSADEVPEGLSIPRWSWDGLQR